MRPPSIESERILVPIDGSEASQHALEYALSFPAAEITLFTVIDPFDTDPLSTGLQSPSGIAGIPGYSSEWYDGVREEAEKMQAQAKEQAATTDISVSTEVTFGSPARQIVRFVEEHDIDHVIMGNRGEDSISRILLGSVTESTVRRTPAIVTVVR